MTDCGDVMLRYANLLRGRQDGSIKGLIDMSPFTGKSASSYLREHRARVADTMRLIKAFGDGNERKKTPTEG